MDHWWPRVELSKQEAFIMKRLNRVRALFGFLRLNCRRPSRSAEIWSTGVRADLGARVWMESKRPSATIGCAGPHVLLGFARQAFGGFFPALVGVVGLVRCR